jgi:hypothetical protein
MRRVYLVVAIIAIFACAVPTLYPQTATLSPQDMHAAEVRYVSLRPVRFILSPSLDLHSLPRDSDGARGYTISSDCQCVATPKGPFKTVADAEFHDKYCYDASIVIARMVSARSYLSTKKDLIFTLSQFQVTDSLKSATDAEVGKLIGVMRFGGEVVDAGETLRAQYAGQIPFTTDKTYLLELIRDAENPSSYFFGWETILVEDGRISLPDISVDSPSTGETSFPGSWGPFKSGELVTTIHKRVAEIAAVVPCPPLKPTP